jgi:hypothetical protein
MNTLSSKTKSNKRRGPRGAFRRESLANYLDISVSALDRLDAAGLVPAASKLSGCKIWVKRTIDIWLSMNCPPRQEFETRLAARKAAKQRRHAS